MDYESSPEGAGAGNVENIVRLLMTVQEAIEGGQSTGGGDEAFWRRALAELLRNAVELALAAGEGISVPILAQIVDSAPTSAAQVKDKAWSESSYCYKLIIKAAMEKYDSYGHWQQQDIRTTLRYWKNKFPEMPEKQRGSILSMFSGIIDNFMRRPFRQLFSEVGGGDNVLFPELCYDGVVIVLNFPVKEFGESGRAVQVVYKYLWQQAMERRPPGKTRPCFLWVDESQNFATEYDMQFQATARSSRACTVFLTQNLPNYYAEIGNQHRVNSLLGNLQTKIWHANSDPETNENAADVIGRSWQTKGGESVSSGNESASFSRSSQDSLEYDVTPQEFTMLPKEGRSMTGLLPA